MKILITGSEGVIGRGLKEALGDKGYTVFGVDLYHKEGETGWERPMSPHDYYARCDVSDYRQIKRVITKYSPDLVYHAAAEFGRWNGEDYYEQLWRTNAIGTKNIIRLQEKHGFKMVFFSSSEVYGDFPGIMAEDVMDTREIKQLNDYALSKWVNEQQIRNSQAQHGTQTVIVRLFNTYGPGEAYHPYRSVNAKFCHHALIGWPIIVYRGHHRTSTYLSDTCNALANIIKNFKPGEAYNIGGIEYHSIEDLVEIVWSITGADRRLIHYEDSEVLTTKSKKVDISKAVRDLKLELTVSLREGVEKTIQWMRGL